MTRDSAISRRTALKLTGGAAATALVAGCNDNGNGNGEDDDADAEPDGFEIEPGTEIEFDAQTPGWVGMEPAEIDGEENPTLILEEGEEYTMGWNEGDGAEHNIEIRDDGGDVVDDLQTEEVTEGGEDQFLTFEASSEMAAYVCDPHETTMNGDLVVE
ncbi:plastocyanin/azurin family copper-binding protein [Natrarchaeobaculum aegyptiacum]|uniref:Blue (type 1) copper domain-containing protein n=1 Tax=Natrarchaeobaculum aegyptiacum TaxID=745377 RepID=A0A2Z2HRX1_9EURY|nr:twin-arginine translocation signal domain-containing protein [Natrarchaeobaculum aegyptiacum]ARS89849.1 hypothetical protein B1756_08940 [Natrarchaeobaculum aegyptiacum]